MRLENAIKEFGECYNNRDFSSIAKNLTPNCEYQSFDCMYKIVSPEDVIKVLNESNKNRTSAYNGFCNRKGMLLKRIKECVLICDDDTFKCLRIVIIRTKRRKISNITGYNTDEYNYTRGKKICD